MRIEIVGVGCAACRRMEEDVRNVVDDLGLAAEIARVADIDAVIRSGLLNLPALLVDGRPVVAGYRGRKGIERALREADASAQVAAA